MVAAPALVLLGLGAGADLGTVFVAGCLALAVGMLAGLAAALPAEGTSVVVVHWAHPTGQALD